MNAEPAPSQPDGYWSKYPTIVITWPGDMPGVFASARWRRNPDGSLSVEYTRDELELAIGGARVSSQLEYAHPTPEPELAMPQPARLVFGRISKADGRKLVKQAEQAQQEALL